MTHTKLHTCMTWPKEEGWRPRMIALLYRASVDRLFSVVIFTALQLRAHALPCCFLLLKLPLLLKLSRLLLLKLTLPHQRC